MVVVSIMKRGVAITVYGTVQGVGFRYFTQRTAALHGISGFAMNRDDGSVYIEAHGESKEMEMFIQSVRKGPSFGRVDNIVLMDLEYDPGTASFSIKYS